MSTEQKEKLSQQDILKEYKVQLQELKKQIKENNFDKNHFDTLVKGLWKNVELKNEVSEKDIDDLINYLENLEENELNEATLESMKNALNEIKKTKKSLDKLKKEVDKIDDKKKMLEEKVNKYKEKFKKISEKHPFWTKALLSLLPDKLKWLFLPKKQLSNVDSSDFFQIINKMKEFLSKFFTPILAFLFPFFAPKELKDFLQNIKNDLWNVDLGILSKFTGKLWETFELSQEKKEELLNKINEKLKVAIKNTIKKISGENITEEKLNRIMEKINVKGLYNDSEILKVWEALDWKKVEWANWAKAWIEWLTLPFKLASKIFYVLNQEWYISIWDVVVHFGKKSGEIVLNSFSLLWSGVELIKWTISPGNFEKEVKDLLDTSPETWKLILSIMMYRHWWVLFSTVWKISEYLGKFIIYSLSGESSAYKTVVSGLKWNVDEYLRVLKKFNSLVPEDIKVQKLSLLEKTIKDLEKANELIKILNKNPQITGRQLKDKYPKLAKFLWDNIDNLDAKKLRSVLSANIENIWKSLNLFIWEVPAYVSKTFKWIVWEKYLLNDLGKRIETTTKYLANVVRDDTLFWKTKSFLSRFWLTKEMLEIDPTYDKMVFKFKDVKTFKEFGNNLLILAKQSPEILRFMFDKLPIFVVAWLSVDSAKEGDLWEIVKNLSLLVPVIGSWFMLVDSLYVWKENLTQTYIASVLLIWEFGYIGYKWLIKRDLKWIINFILKPGKDLAEIVWAISKTVFTSWKVAKDFGKIVINWVSIKNLDELKLLYKNKLSPALVKNPRLVPFLLVFWFGTYLFADDNDFIKEFKKTCKWDLDDCLKAKWAELENEEKAQVIEASFKTHLLSTEWISCEYKDWKYQIVFDENFSVLPNYEKISYLSQKIEKLLKKYWDENVKILLSVKQSLVDKYFDKFEVKDNQKKRELLDSMGYPEKAIKELLESKNVFAVIWENVFS